MTLSEYTLQTKTQAIETTGENSFTDKLFGKPDEIGKRYFPRLSVNNVASGSIVIVSPLIIVLLTIILESIQPEYDRIEDTISKLVWLQFGWLETVCFYLFALVLAVLALNLNRLSVARRNLRFSSLIISLMSVGFIIIAIIPTNAPGEPTTLTVSIHRFTASGICLLFPIVCLSMARGLKGEISCKRIRDFSLVTGGFGIVLAIAGLLIIVTETPWKGAIERIILANGILWVIVVGFWSISKYYFLLLTSNTTHEAVRQ